MLKEDLRIRMFRNKLKKIVNNFDFSVVDILMKNNMIKSLNIIYENIGENNEKICKELYRYYIRHNVNTFLYNATMLLQEPLIRWILTKKQLRPYIDIDTIISFIELQKENVDVPDSIITLYIDFMIDKYNMDFEDMCNLCLRLFPNHKN